MSKPIARRRSHRRAFTLIELLVVIAIIAILAAILFPVFAKAREAARSSACLSHMKQMGMGVMMYTQDYDETMPAASRTWVVNGSNVGARWMHQTYPYIKNAKLFDCPSAPRNLFWSGPNNYGNAGTYGYNARYLNNQALAAIGKPAETYLILETPGGGTSNRYRARPDVQTGTNSWAGAPWGTWAVGQSRVAYRHNDNTNVAFVDGHVKVAKRGDVNRQANNEDGFALSGELRFVFWNRL